MPFALLVIGVILIITAIRNTYAQFGSQLVGDFTGSGSFLYWFAAIAIIGLIGYAPGFEKPSRYLMALILLVFFLKNGTGFWSQFTSAINNPQPSAEPASFTPINQPIPVQVNVSGGGGIGQQAALGAIKGAFGSLLGGL